MARSPKQSAPLADAEKLLRATQRDLNSLSAQIEAELAAQEQSRGKPYTPAYRRRIFGNLLKGKPRQAARGHAPEEHIERRRREERDRGTALTPSQKAQISKYAREQARRVEDSDPDEYRDQMVDAFSELGYDKFLRLREHRNAIIGQKGIFSGEEGVQRQIKRILGITEDGWFLYYH